MEQKTDGSEERPLVRNRPIDILIALLFLGVSGVVIWDSVGATVQWVETATGNWVPKFGIDVQRFGWQEGIGPGPGYFPFYIAVIIALASIVNLYRALTRREAGGSEVFITQLALPRVLSVLVPAIGYVLLIEYVGIYVASAIFLMFFMTVFGRENFVRTLVVGLAVPTALFFMFEKWFLVPLPKGPLEAMLGL